MSHENRKFWVRLCFLKMSEPIKSHQQGRLRITLPDMILIYMAVWVGKILQCLNSTQRARDTEEHWELEIESSCGKRALTDYLVPNRIPKNMHIQAMFFRHNRYTYIFKNTRVSHVHTHAQTRVAKIKEERSPWTWNWTGEESTGRKEKREMMQLYYDHKK